jgi:hypothetical protein
MMTSTWTYRNPGDYDQNGEVNGADMVVMARYYQHTTASPDWGEARLADGNGNGQVEFGDVTPLGQNYGNAVNGYFVMVDFTDLDHNGEVNTADLTPYFKLGLSWPAVSPKGDPILELRLDEPVSLFGPPQDPDVPGPFLLFAYCPISQGVVPDGGGPLQFTAQTTVDHSNVSLIGLWSSICPVAVPATGTFNVGQAGNAERIPVPVGQT